MARSKKSATNASTSKEPPPTQKSQDDLRAIKASCCRTKNISDEDFSKLPRDQQKFLLAQWDRPETLKIVGGSRAMRPNSQIPPPSVFAGSSEYYKNLKSLAQWWSMSIQDQDKRISEYDALSHSTRITFHCNIGTMLHQQEELYCKLHGIEEPVHFDHGNDHDDDGVEEEEMSFNNSRTRSASIGSINDRPLSHRRIISPVPRQAEMQRASSTEPPLPSLPHLAGIFVNDNTRTTVLAPTVKGQGRHFGKKTVLDSSESVLDKLQTVFDEHPGDPHASLSEFNEVVVIHVRNIYWSSICGGKKFMKRLPGNEVRVTCMGRSEGIIVRASRYLACALTSKSVDTIKPQFITNSGSSTSEESLAIYKTSIKYEREHEV